MLGLLSETLSNELSVTSICALKPRFRAVPVCFNRLVVGRIRDFGG